MRGVFLFREAPKPSVSVFMSFMQSCYINGYFEFDVCVWGEHFVRAELCNFVKHSKLLSAQGTSGATCGLRSSHRAERRP